MDFTRNFDFFPEFHPFLMELNGVMAAMAMNYCFFSDFFSEISIYKHFLFHKKLFSLLKNGQFFKSCGPILKCPKSILSNGQERCSMAVA